MGFYGEAVVGGVEHLRERYEVEEDSGDGGGDGDVAPAGTVIEGCGQDREGGDAVEQDSDSEPEEGHEYVIVAAVHRPQTLSISCGGKAEICRCSAVVTTPSPSPCNCAKSSKQIL